MGFSWTPGSSYSGPFWKQLFTKCCTSNKIEIGSIDRGLNIQEWLNNSQVGGIYQATQSFPAILRTSIQGTEPEILIDQQYLHICAFLKKSISTFRRDNIENISNSRNRQIRAMLNNSFYELLKEYTEHPPKV